MSWTDKVKVLASTDPASVAPFVEMDEEQITSHAFFGMLNGLWNNYVAAAKKTSTKKVLTEEEKDAYRKEKMNTYFNGLESKFSSTVFKKKYHTLLDEEQLKLTQKKASIIGLKVIEAELEKLSKDAPTSTKTLPNGRKVANHNNHFREEDELVKNEDGTKKEVCVNFPKSPNEICGIIPTPGDDKMNKYWTFDELDGMKSVERAEKGHPQVFIKSMGFRNNPSHIAGKCNCAANLNKKLALHAYTETIDEDGLIHYNPSNLTSIPQFCCNKPINANGVCKAHGRMLDEGKSVDKWDESKLNGWTPKYESV